MNTPSLKHAGLPPFDPRRAGFLTDPYSVYDEYRAGEPVHWSGCPSGTRGGRWFVFDHRSAVKVLTDNRFRRQAVAAPGKCPVSAHAGGPVPAAPPPAEARDQSVPCEYAAMIANWMLFQDPPKHTRLRSAVGRAFGQPAVQTLRPQIERRVEELLAGLDGRDSFDLLSEFAFPLPLDVIADVLGVDASERGAFHDWSAALRDAIDTRQGTDVLARARTATRGLRDYFEAAWDRHRVQPGKGVLGALFCLEGLEEGLSKEEAFGTFSFLITGGHETTTNLLGTGLYLLGRHPLEALRLREQPALINKAVEEIVRFESPAQMTTRIVAEELELGNRRLAPGQRVDVLLGSANRDPAVFAVPGRFDVGRSPNPHLAFGLGSHYCLGTALARLIGSIALPELLKRVRVCAVPADATQWTASIGFRGLTHLRCTPA